MPISKVKRAKKLLRGGTNVGMMVDVGLKNSGAQNLFTKVMNAPLIRTMGVFHYARLG